MSNQFNIKFILSSVSWGEGGGGLHLGGGGGGGGSQGAAPYDIKNGPYDIKNVIITPELEFPRVSDTSAHID